MRETNLTQRRKEAKAQPNGAKRLECAVFRRFYFETLYNLCTAPEYGALQTLRDIQRHSEFSLLTPSRLRVFALAFLLIACRAFAIDGPLTPEESLKYLK